MIYNPYLHTIVDDTNREFVEKFISTLGKDVSSNYEVDITTNEAYDSFIRSMGRIPDSAAREAAMKQRIAAEKERAEFIEASLKTVGSFISSIFLWR